MRLTHVSITKKHGLPIAGGWMDQPAALMDLFVALDTEEALMRAKPEDSDGDT